MESITLNKNQDFEWQQPSMHTALKKMLGQQLNSSIRLASPEEIDAILRRAFQELPRRRRWI
ncbi:MAG: hypothetical protein HKL80_03225 [Acidimicrobiales bacterium]|nr:hypothetical protein [Acidimicrobiales bacterium]